MDMHVDAARDDLAARGIDDLGTGARPRGQIGADGRDRFAADRDVGPRFSRRAQESTVRDNDIVIHGADSP